MWICNGSLWHAEVNSKPRGHRWSPPWKINCTLCPCHFKHRVSQRWHLDIFPFWQIPFLNRFFVSKPLLHKLPWEVKTKDPNGGDFIHKDFNLSNEACRLKCKIQKWNKFCWSVTNWGALLHEILPDSLFVLHSDGWSVQVCLGSTAPLYWTCSVPPYLCFSSSL